MTQPRLILFPGLAADERLYGAQRRAFPNMLTPNYIAPHRREDIRGYSRRMAAMIDPSTGPFYLGGLSFGSAVALEAARHLPTLGIFLIGGTLSYRAIAWPFRLLCHAARFVPAWVVRVGLPVFPVALDVLEGLDDEHKNLYARMARQSSAEMIRWGAASMIGWEFDRAALPHVPIYAIHGERDEIIPIRHVRPDHVVRGGRHLISLKQTDEVNRFLAETMRAGAASRAPQPVR